MNRIFLLSPARAGGKRAAMLTRAAASFELARQVQIGAATLGEVFTFCSGLYFAASLPTRAISPTHRRVWPAFRSSRPAAGW